MRKPWNSQLSVALTISHDSSRPPFLTVSPINQPFRFRRQFLATVSRNDGRSRTISAVDIDPWTEGRRDISNPSGRHLERRQSITEADVNLAPIIRCRGVSRILTCRRLDSLRAFTGGFATSSPTRSPNRFSLPFSRSGYNLDDTTISPPFWPNVILSPWFNIVRHDRFVKFLAEK